MLQFIFIGCAHPTTHKSLTLEGYWQGLTEISKFQDATLVGINGTNNIMPGAQIFLGYRLDTETATMDYVNIITTSQSFPVTVGFNNKKGITTCFDYRFATKGKAPAHYQLRVCYAPDVSNIHPTVPVGYCKPQPLPLTEEMKKFMKTRGNRKPNNSGYVWMGYGVVVLFNYTSFGQGGDEIQKEEIRFGKKLLKYVFDVYAKILENHTN